MQIRYPMGLLFQKRSFDSTLCVGILPGERQCVYPVVVWRWAFYSHVALKFSTLTRSIATGLLCTKLLSSRPIQAPYVHNLCISPVSSQHVPTDVVLRAPFNHLNIQSLMGWYLNVELRCNQSWGNINSLLLCPTLPPSRSCLLSSRHRGNSKSFAWQRARNYLRRRNRGIDRK